MLFEGLSNLYDVVDLQPWPKNPKFIFTSNNFYRDELFKLWTATKVVSGSKYVNQHGNNIIHEKINFLELKRKQLIDLLLEVGQQINKG